MTLSTKKSVVAIQMAVFSGLKGGIRKINFLNEIKY